MWILGKNGDKIVNSNMIQNIGAISLNKNILWADDINLGEFQTEDEAKKELKQIYDALISGQESYSVG